MFIFTIYEVRLPFIVKSKKYNKQYPQFDPLLII